MAWSGSGPQPLLLGPMQILGCAAAVAGLVLLPITNVGGEPVRGGHAGQPAGSSPHLRSETPLSAAQRALRDFIREQHLVLAREGSFYPVQASWTFLEDLVSTDAWIGRNAPDEETLISFRETPPGFRSCFSAGPYTVARPLAAACPGEWVQYRADDRSSGASTFRLNWTGAPRIELSYPLRQAQALDPVRFAAAELPILGTVAFVQEGSGLQAVKADGARLWSNLTLGLGEIIDVVDLDGDGSYELVYSSHARINPNYAAASGPGTLFVLSANSGEVLWSYAFHGLVFGLNRYRTTIANINGAPTKSILAVMTYSASLVRFDFDRGARNGRVAWSSPPFGYESPDKAPLLVDLEHDGTSEIVVDSQGVIYVLRAADGAILSRLAYSKAPTFGGFLAAADLDGDGLPEIISVSDTFYFKGYAVASWRRGRLTLRNHHVWEEGLENGEYEVRVLNRVLQQGGSPGLLAVSVKRKVNGSTTTRLQLLDPLSGNIKATLEGHELSQALSVRRGTAQLATQTEAGSAVVEVSVATPSLSVVTRCGPDAATEPRSLAWLPQTGNDRPSERGADISMAGIAVQGTGAIWICKNAQAATLVRAFTAAATDRGQLSAHPIDSNSVLLSDGLTGRRVDASGRTSTWFTHSSRSFVTPLVADLDGSGRKQLIVPIHGGLARLTVLPGRPIQITRLIPAAPVQDRESFHVPIIGSIAGSLARFIAGFELITNGDGATELAVAAVSASGQKLWSRPLEAGNWESMIAGVRGRDGTTNVALRDSRSTSEVDGRSGAVLWTVATVGQCQRQMASIDWDGDGAADLAVQAGDVTWIHNGNDGHALSIHTMKASYGAYSTFARASDRTPFLVEHNAGGLSIIDSDGVKLDRQVDTRGIEAIPVVVGPRSRGQADAVFQITGSGHLRVINLSGDIVDEAELSASVVTMTGAYINADDSLDLLISTFNGDLIAVSGTTLRELWRVNLGAAAGSAVATDLYGDARGEIVVVSSDGVLHIIAPATARVAARQRPGLERIRASSSLAPT